MLWLSLFALGAMHGINPAMGWLFAVGRGLQSQSRRALWSAFAPLAIGHALAIAAALAAAIALGHTLPIAALRWAVAASLSVVGVRGLVRHPHVRLGGMRVSARQLMTWSFLMSSAHGAGLMVLPFVLGAAAPAIVHEHSHMAMAAAGGVAQSAPLSVSAPLVHTLGYLVVTVAVAVIVYEKVGVRILRRAWINLDVIWSAALIVAAAASALG